MKAGRIAGQLVALVLLGFLAWFLSVYRFVDVIQHSMEPTLEPRDKLLVNVRAPKQGPPPRGSIVVLQPPQEDEWVVKRVIGVENDDILIGPSGLVLNGRRIQEDYITRQSGDAPAGGIVPADSIYVLGDNRPQSNDSRDYGPVPVDRVIGIVVRVVSPAEHRKLLPPAPALADGS